VRATAFLHAGCIMQVAFAAWNEATVRVLNAAGVASSSPRLKAAAVRSRFTPARCRADASSRKRNIAAFERSGADVYIINAAGCGSALKEYGELFAGDPEWQNRAIAFSAERARCQRVSRRDRAAGGTAGARRTHGHLSRCVPPRARAAHHGRTAPAARGGSRPAAARDGRVVAVLRFGRDLQRHAAEMAQRLQRRKVDRVLEVAPEIVVTANPGCALQLRNGLDRADASHIAVRHIVEILDESLRSGSLRATPNGPRVSAGR
jgi:glycolate oxidase iron-sulfur subunit